MMFITSKLGQMLESQGDKLSRRNLRDTVSMLAKVQRVAHLNLGIDRKTARATAQPMSVEHAPAHDTRGLLERLAAALAQP